MYSACDYVRTFASKHTRYIDPRVFPVRVTTIAKRDSVSSSSSSRRITDGRKSNNLCCNKNKNKNNSY